MKIKKEELVYLLKENTFNTMGCTEVISIILAVSAAYNVVKGHARQVNVILDKNLFKNAFRVGIPGTSESGLELAAVLGLTLDKWQKGLLISEEIEEDKLLRAKDLKKKLAVNIEPCYGADSIYVKAEVVTEKGCGTCLIEGKHDNITLLKENERIIINNPLEEKQASSVYSKIASDFDLESTIESVKNLEESDLGFMDEGIQKNITAAELGISERAGLGLGYRYSCLIDEGVLEDNIFNRARMLVAGAADARMGGLKAPIVGCFGSGNHGITIFLPLKVLADDLGCSKKALFQSISLAELLTAAIKNVTGLVTSYCGDIIATGAGVAGGACYLQGKSLPVLEKALQLLLANQYGVICDGAKSTCALKIATAAQIGLECSFLADGINNFGPQGVIGKNFADTLHNLDFLIRKDGGASDLNMIALLETGQ